MHKLLVVESILLIVCHFYMCIAVGGGSADTVATTAVLTGRLAWKRNM